MKKTRVAFVCRSLILLALLARSAGAANPSVPDFCFVQVSDLHISPQPAEQSIVEENGSADTIAWVCQEAQVGQKLGASSITTPPPAFVMATGAGGKVYLCSNRNTLSVLDAGSGKLLRQYQVTPRTDVMGSVAADKVGNVCVAAMDGSVTRLFAQDNTDQRASNSERLSKEATPAAKVVLPVQKR